MWDDFWKKTWVVHLVVEIQKAKRNRLINNE